MYTKGGTIAVSNKHIVGNTYSLEDVEIDGEKYVFTVHAVDKAGNASDTIETSIIPTEGASVQSIELSRYHLAYNDPDQTITAIAKLNNADLIDNDTVVKFQIKDSDGNVTNTIANVDKIEGTATATLTAPSKGNNSEYEGASFTVLCKIGDAAADSIHTTRFNVSSASSLVNVGIYSNNYYTTGTVHIPIDTLKSKSSESVRITGYNLDLTILSVQIYNSRGDTCYLEPLYVDTTSISWSSNNGKNYQTVDTVIPLPEIDDYYTIKVFFDGILQYRFGYFRIYNVPTFTNFTIPAVSISKSGKTVTAKIEGNYFNTPDTDFSNFNVTCSEDLSIVSQSSFTKYYDSDEILFVSFQIPETVGEYEITVSYGKNSISSTLIAVPACCVGDVLLDDGTVIPYNKDNLNFSDIQKQKAVGVLCGVTEYGVPIGYIGLYNSSAGNNSGRYEWTTHKISDNFISLDEISCCLGAEGPVGNLIGKDNWQYICSRDAVGSTDAAKYYPAFNYANNYASAFHLSGKYSDGWYIPSYEELFYIYCNKDILNLVINKLGGIVLDNSDYWSSSQYSDSCNDAWYVNFNGENTDYYDDNTSFYKGNAKNICVIRPFD